MNLFTTGTTAGDVWLGLCVVGVFTLLMLAIDGVVHLIRQRRR